MKKSIKQITISFCITLLFLGGIVLLGLTHYRIENTINASEYTLLEMYRVGKNQLDVMFDNNSFSIDLTEINYLWGEVTSLEMFIPTSIKIITSSLDLIVQKFTEYIYLFYVNNSIS